MHHKTLHVCYIDKFIPGFIELVRHDVEAPNNNFYLMGDLNRYPYNVGDDTEYQKNKLGYFKLLFKMREYDKIILHGLFNKYLIMILAFQPGLLKRCYWVIWGGDLYSYEVKKTTLKAKFVEACRRKIIPKMGYLVTHVPGDVGLARQWYNARGEYIECLMYPSNTFKGFEPLKTFNKNSETTVLVGNSGSKTNNHVEILHQLKNLNTDKVRVVCPLSYGKKSYSEFVISEGRRLFGDKFIPVVEFLPFSEYIMLLGDVDIAIFNHRRQQAMGNIINLLGLGKKVYMRSDITSWSVFHEMGIKIYDVESINLSPIEERVAKSNQETICSHFTRERLINQLKGFL